MSFITSLGDWLRKITRSFTSASISGQNITLTRHNGDTVVLTTQDTVNNAFTKIKLGTVTLEPDAINDTLTLGVGAGIQLSANATNDSITVSGVEATQSISGIMSTADKIKLDGITSGAEPNQNAFAIVKVGATSVTADTKQDTLNLSAGTGITISPNATTDTVTISVTDNTYAAYSHTHEYLPLSGGTMTGNITRKTDVTRGTAPTATVTAALIDVRDVNNTRYGLIESNYRTNNESEISIYAYKTIDASGNNIGKLGIGSDENGNVYTVAPTPSVTDDSTKIATTAYVKNCVPKSTGSTTRPVYTDADGVVTACTDSFEIVEAKSIGTSGYIKYRSGLMIAWGTFSIPSSNPSGGKEVTFLAAFSAEPMIVVTPRFGSVGSAVSTFKVYPRSSTGFTAYLRIWNGSALSWDHGNCGYIAIGYYQ